MVDLPLREGMTGSARILVGEEHTAPRVGSGRVRVLATPVMINLMEAAAPVGMGLRATAVVTRLDGRTIEFRVEAFDDKERVGDGTHTRVVVNVERFDQRVQRKLG